MRYFLLKASTKFRGSFEEFYVPIKCEFEKEGIAADIIYELEAEKLIMEKFGCQSYEIRILNLEVIEEIPFDVYACSRLTLISKDDKDVPVYLYKSLLEEIRAKANIVDIGLYTTKPCIY